MADYISIFSGSQMDEADTLSLNPDAVPTEGSGNLVTSDGVARAIGSATDNSAPAILNTASGAVCSFPDGSASPMRSVVAQIVATQAGSGDPAPDNIRPISGYAGANITRAGRNLIPEPYASTSPLTANGVTFTANADGTITVSDTATANTFFNLATTYLLPTGTYTVKRTGNSALVLLVRNTGGTTLAQSSTTDATLTLTEPTVVNLFLRANNGGAFGAGVTVEPQIELGSTAHDFEAYNATVFSVSWQDAAGTVYGGNADAVNGAGQRTWAKVTLDSTIPAGTAGIRNISELADGVRFEYYPYRAVGSTTVNEMMSNKFAFGDTSTGTPFTISGASGSARMYLCLPSEYNTDALIRQWFTDNPTDVVYPLETPESFAFSGVPIESLLGQNNIWNDVNGDTSAEYRADTKLYIDAKIAALGA